MPPRPGGTQREGQGRLAPSDVLRHPARRRRHGFSQELLELRWQLGMPRGEGTDGAEEVVGGLVGVEQFGHKDIRRRITYPVGLGQVFDGHGHGYFPFWRP